VCSTRTSTGIADVEPARIDLGDVGDEHRFDSPRPPHQLREAPQKLVVGNVLQLVVVRHDNGIPRQFSTSWRRACATE
jgi:hypothetical protein